MKMIKNRYLKWFLVMLSYSLMYVISLIIYIPFVYPFRKHIRAFKDRYKVAYFFWLFLNDTEKANDKDIDFGDYGRFKHNVWGAFRQSVIRNNSWNYKLVMGEGLNEQVTSMKTIFYDGKQPQMWLRNYKIHGYQFCTYEIKDKKFFRASFTFVFFNRLLWNMQSGCSTTRYLFKMRLKWLS